MCSFGCGRRAKMQSACRSWRGWTPEWSLIVCARWWKEKIQEKKVVTIIPTLVFFDALLPYPFLSTEITVVLIKNPTRVTLHLVTSMVLRVESMLVYNRRWEHSEDRQTRCTLLMPLHRQMITIKLLFNKRNIISLYGRITMYITLFRLNHLISYS